MHRVLLCAANLVTRNYDAVGRVSSLVNNLGTFSRYFVDFTEAGTNYVRKTSRLDHIDLPNGLRTSLEYFTAAQGGVRLRTLRHELVASAGTVSQFDYSYTPGGTMKTWKRQFAAASPDEFRLTHDEADQITAARLVDQVFVPLCIDYESIACHD